ncbi:MAG: ABC transporter permease [Bacteroides sp.]|nr:ABC transporter permease [Bacteroides sp.]
MLDLINEILLTLRTNKMRTVLTGFAVSWGIFLLIVLLSVARGVVNKSQQFFSSQDSDILQIHGGWTQMPYKGYKEWRQINLKSTDPDYLKAVTGDGLHDVKASIRNSSAVVSTGRDYVNSGYQGVMPGNIDAEGGVKLTLGRDINPIDMQEMRRVVVLSRRNADNLLDPSRDPLGQLVTINGLTFTVVGIYESEWRNDVYIPYSVARNMSTDKTVISQIRGRMTDISTLEQSQQVETEVRNALARVHDFDPADESAVWIWNRFERYVNTLEAQTGLSIAVWILGILTLISGIVGVSNIMFVSVRERTHEIGIRRAIGARPLVILRQIILESVAITSIFGYIGILAGMGTAELLGKLIAGPQSPLLNPRIDLSIAVQVMVVLIVAGALAGLFPALKSLKIKPVEALRDE